MNRPSDIFARNSMVKAQTVIKLTTETKKNKTYFGIIVYSFRTSGRTKRINEPKK